MPREQLTWFTLGIAVAAFLGFFAVRNSLRKIVLLTANLKMTMSDKIDEKVILDLAKGDGEVAELAKTFGEIFKKLESNIRELEYTKKKLHEVLSKVGKALASIENFDLIIQLILETAKDALEVEQGAVFSFSDQQNLNLKALVGFNDVSKEEVTHAADSSIRWVLAEKKTLVIPCLENNSGDNTNLFLSPLVYTPLIFRDKVWGVLCLSGRPKGSNFNEDELKLISNLSYQMAVSFENVSLSKDIERTHFETIAALALAVEAKDPYSRGHSERVGEYAVKIGKELGISDKEIQTLRDASRLHDLGKIGIADNVLKKESSLSEQEWDVMIKHPTIGESIVKPLKTFHHLLGPVRHHHEFLDGTGYPDGLKGEDIPVMTRILTVSDIYDALTTDRPYRKALGMKEVKQEFERLIRDGKIDEKVVSALFEAIEGKK